MAQRVGFELEPEVPENIGYAYPIVPKFPQMLKEFGDYIAYKMEKVLKQEHHPRNLFVVHPNEPGANSVSDRLRLRFIDQLLVVRIPRDVIKMAQSSGNAWGNVLRTIKKTEDWIMELNSVRGESAVITDIFNGSGSTFLSIYKLLVHFEINVFCYFPFVDRDCDVRDKEKYPCKKYSLYDWYGPRRLRR